MNSEPDDESKLDRDEAEMARKLSELFIKKPELLDVLIDRLSSDDIVE